MSTIQQLAETPQWELALFNSLYFVGLILLVVVILPPLFARNVRRSKLWFAFMGSCLLYCLAFLLLIGQQLGPEPPFGLCMFQASLIHAVPAFATLTGVCFVVDLYCAMRLSLLPSNWIPVKRTTFLITLPLVAFFGIVIISLVIGFQDHTNVSREPNNMFCHINTGLPTLVSAVLSACSIFVAIGFEISAGIMIYSHSHCTSVSKVYSDKQPTDAHIAPGMLVRISLFSLLTLLGLVFSAVMMFHVYQPEVEWNLLLPILPTLAAVLFGAQRDIILGWRFWKHETKAAQPGAV
ncbi:hypothetical protein C8F04DRAFT_1072952 [Mycena alexandri]|uniref:Uncharacterized protein n=1 Tax=Mycena alexandri TaxID=1745969 RepID=A0AAD6TBU8_9AGAR|nr:hypothetical protein C8F04DRAFT_1072952 [Mycena alexandri]